MKSVKLTESDLNRIVRKVINENTTNPNYENLANMLEKAMKGGGTDLDSIKIVFDQINNKQEFNEVEKILSRNNYLRIHATELNFIYSLQV
mgnify:CR=1 FL=1